MSTVAQTELLGPVLKQVSRSFYLTLRVLPAEIRPQISLAYLLARASDTVADTKAVPQAERIVNLRAFLTDSRCRLAPTAADTPGEKILLERLDDCFALLATFAPVDQQLIRELLQTITSGQIFDLERFPGETAAELAGLADDKELDRYTYLVAGCVGEFWTKMCAAHLPGLAALQIEDGVRFGKGLQLVNILRDIPKDLRIGRCYLPVRNPETLLDPDSFSSIRSVYQHWLDVAVEHLDAGWRYTLAYPAKYWRLRLACTWPIWIGLRTLALLREANPLDPTKRVMVPQGAVNRMLVRSLVTCRSDRWLDGYYRKLRAMASARP